MGENNGKATRKAVVRSKGVRLQSLFDSLKSAKEIATSDKVKEFGLPASLTKGLDDAISHVGKELAKELGIITK